MDPRVAYDSISARELRGDTELRGPYLKFADPYEGFDELGHCRALARVRALDVGDCVERWESDAEFGSARWTEDRTSNVACAIATSPYLRGLVHLSFDGPLDAESLRWLLRDGVLPALECLQIVRTSAHDVIDVLREVPPRPALKRLNLLGSSALPPEVRARWGAALAAPECDLSDAR
jgi:hypothetical protein